MLLVRLSFVVAGLPHFTARENSIVVSKSRSRVSGKVAVTNAHGGLMLPFCSWPFSSPKQIPMRGEGPAPYFISSFQST